eukprot:CAMPEP_0205919624 /NCGR_PEP_ID=MMETSP1325-20131115/10560_1 /ASSEMBLY_ACC=CAM_ASM_000708 /TAXON_ID=236786 /ORGANISM="Florenciella sp., Strain RCC1007" /LENGTH=129 /DNA_ID=CAMNT_0053287249 /DNA_START=17 /DNA_END=402 /DNA_ORIENTATION=-
MRRTFVALAPTKKASFIGLGAIGKVLAGRVAGAEELSSLSVFDLNPAPGKSLEESHAGKVTSATDLADAVSDAQVILTCLPRSSNVKSVADELVAKQALAPGSVWVDCTSGDPTFAATIAGVLEEAGCT